MILCRRRVDAPRRGPRPGRRTAGRPDPMSMPGAAPPVPALEPGAPPLAILVDYDGTIALTDVSDTVMAEYVTRRLGGPGGGVRRRAHGLAAADDPRDGDGRCGPGGLARHGRRAAARPRVRPVRPVAPRRPASRSRSCPTGSASSSSRRCARWASASSRSSRPGRSFAGRRASIEYPERPPGLLRVRHLQAPARPGPPGRWPGRALHRRRRERPLRRGLQRHRLRQAVARAHLRRGRLAVPALDGVQRDRDLARGDARRLACRSVDAAASGSHTRSSAARRSGARAARTRRGTHGRRPTGEPRRASPSAPSVRTTRTGPSRA